MFLRSGPDPPGECDPSLAPWLPLQVNFLIIPPTKNSELLKREILRNELHNSVITRTRFWKERNEKMEYIPAQFLSINNSRIPLNGHNWFNKIWNSYKQSWIPSLISQRNLEVTVPEYKSSLIHKSWTRFFAIFLRTLFSLNLPGSGKLTSILKEESPGQEDNRDLEEVEPRESIYGCKRRITKRKRIICDLKREIRLTYW